MCTANEWAGLVTGSRVHVCREGRRLEAQHLVPHQCPLLAPVNGREHMRDLSQHSDCVL